MTIAELINLLSDLPPTWDVEGTHSRSLAVYDAERWADVRQYGYVFTDGRPTRIMRRAK